MLAHETLKTRPKELLALTGLARREFDEPDQDSNSGNTVAIQMIKLENEGREREADIQQPHADC